MKKISTLCLLLIALGTSRAGAQTYHNLAGGPLSQNWTDISLIATDDIWTNVPSIRGFLGDDAAGAVTAVDPQTIIVPGTGTLDVIANQASPNTQTSGGVGEFELTNPTIALQGSGTADYPNIVLYVNTTGTSANTLVFNIRDIDGAVDNAIQPIAVQYRVGNTGNFTNIPAGYVADASTGPSLATLVTPVSIILPAATDNQAMVEIRILTTNAVGSDEWLGIDDIVVTAGAPTPITLQSFSVAKSGHSNEINWFVNCTSASVKFELERSANSAHFLSIHSESATQARCAAAFKYLDADPISGGNYYRLKMIDLDGSATYSKIAYINNKNGSGTVLSSIQPNVITTQLTILVQSSAKQKLDLLITDLSGRVLRKESQNLNAGENILQLNLGSIPAGTYQVSGFTSGEKLNTLRFIKQ